MNDIPAFPESYVDGVAPYEGIGGGMKLRDYFAASALPAVFNEFFTTLCAREISLSEDWRLGIAHDAYEMADAMLAERSKKS